MNFQKLNDWVSTKSKIPSRLCLVASIYLMFLIMPMRKHTLDAAARLFNTSKPRFGKFLKNHSNTAIYALSDLSKRQSKQFAKVLGYLADNRLPWKIAVIIDSTLQRRASLNTDNSQRFNHGKGYVIGHQWTNIVLVINDKLVPLPPIPFYSKNYCRQNNLEYQTENTRVTDYLRDLDLGEHIGRHDPGEVVVLADSAYDDQKIEKTIAARKWKFIISMKTRRTFKTENQYRNSPMPKFWKPISEIFKRNRRVKWQTIRITRNSGKKRRTEFRIRQITGCLRNYGMVQLICSEFKKGPKGRRKYLACNDLKVKPRQIVVGYRIRWQIEIFHKEAKMFMGFEDVSAKSFKSVVSHVHWVYCACILLKYRLSDRPVDRTSIGAGQLIAKEAMLKKNLNAIRQLLTQIDGVARFKSQLRRVIEGDSSCGCPNLQGVVIL